MSKKKKEEYLKKNTAQEFEREFYEQLVEIAEQIQKKHNHAFDEELNNYWQSLEGLWKPFGEEDREDMKKLKTKLEEVLARDENEKISK